MALSSGAKGITFDTFSEAMDIFRNNWQPYVIFTTIVAGISCVCIGISYIPMFLSIMAMEAAQSDMPPLQMFLMYPVLLILSSLMQVTTYIGYAAITRKLMITGTATWNDGTDAITSRFGSVIGLALLHSVGMIAGFLACGIGILFVMPALMFAPIVFTIHDRSPMESVTESWELVKEQFWMALAFSFVMGIVGQIGAYACYVGLLATMPFAGIMITLAYRDTIGETWGVPTSPFPGAPTPTNYPREQGGQMPNYHQGSVDPTTENPNPPTDSDRTE